LPAPPLLQAAETEASPYVGPLAKLGFLGGGALWGLIADRVSARWPAHEDGSQRPPGWRTVVTAAISGLAFWALTAFFDRPAALVFLGLYVAALVILLATDLDQRLLPDVLTLPMIPYALIGAWLGISPYVSLQSGFVLDVAAAVGLPLFLFVLSIPFGSGAIGIGDLKLLVSVGFLAGAERAVIGLIFGAILSAVVILVLIVARRITLRSYIPYGPFLIIGVLWALLGPVGGRG
jgi:leader peptidase (prepilin peptidase)/N-methyltransferase